MVTMKRPSSQMQAMPDTGFISGAEAPVKAGVSLRQGWPGSVASPDSDRFVQSAKDWLFSLGPGRLRYTPILNRLPVLLARVVRSHLEAGMAGATLNSKTAAKGFRALHLCRADLSEFIDFCENEYSQLQALALQVGLVEAELQRKCQ